MSSYEIDKVLKALTIKDLRQELRARGCSPAGSQETLTERLRQHILESGDTVLKACSVSLDPVAAAVPGNNYSRPEGQNVGNFITDRPSSRVLAAPGGRSTVVLGDDGGNPDFKPDAFKPVASPYGTAVDDHKPSPQPAKAVDPKDGNNYARPGGQNQGNFITTRPSSRVLAPPGGQSSITF